MTGRSPISARRAGWAAITVDANGKVGAGVYLSCPEKFPSLFRAELMAVVQLIRQALPPARNFTDNQRVIDGWR